LPLLAVISVALYLVFHFPLTLLYSAAGDIWAPLAAGIPLATLYVIYRRPLLKIHFKKTFWLGKLLYWTWTAAFALAAGAVAWLVDRTAMVGAATATVIAVYFFRKKSTKWLAFLALAAVVLAAAWRAPWLTASFGRLLFGAVLLGSMVVLFATEEVRRIEPIEFGAMVFLAPLVFSILAFYRAPEPLLTHVPGVEWIHSTAEPAAPARVRRGGDLRFAVRDCQGRLLLGGASQPGLEVLGDHAVVLENAPMGDNLLPLCDGRDAMLYGTRAGNVVWRNGRVRREFAMGQPVLTVQYDPRRYLVFAMNRFTRLVTLDLPNLYFVAQRESGISIDILFSPEQGVLYRSVFLRGVEMLEPATLNVIGTRKFPASVGGTMASDPGHRRLFLSDWLGDFLYVLDARDLAPLAELPTDRGIRQLAFDAKRGLLLAGSYFRGDVLVYRPNAGGSPRRFHVGKRVRGLTLDGDRCLGVSASGIFALDLNFIAAGLGQ
jgi:hypothetical protein